MRLVRERAAGLPPGVWVRSAGYDESRLAEGRHPTRWDLDRAAPNHPVRLLHRSGHAAVLNSRALAVAGVTIATEEPPGTAIDRRLTDGEPTGLLMEMNEMVARVVPPLARADLVAGLREAGRRLLAAGVTAVQDMTHTNGPGAANFLSELAAESDFAPRLLPIAEGWGAVDREASVAEPCAVTPTPHVRPSPSARRAATSPAAAPGVAGGDRARPVKVMVREVGGPPVPDVDDLAMIMRVCGAHDRQVAVHAVERRTVAAVVAAFEQAGEDARAGALRHRIEHAGVCPPDLGCRIAALGLVVVSNPVFLHVSGDRYRRQVAEHDLPHLYAVGALAGAGVRLAAASDAPVAPALPLAAVRAAVTRRTEQGVTLPGVPLAPDRALALVTRGAALASRREDELGQIAPGRPADFTVLSGDPAHPDTVVEATIIGGRVRWSRASAATDAE